MSDAEGVMARGRELEKLAIEHAESKEWVKYGIYRDQLWDLIIRPNDLNDTQKTEVAERLSRVFFHTAEYFYIEEEDFDRVERHTNWLRELHRDFPGSFDIALRLITLMVGYLEMLFRWNMFEHNEILVAELLILTSAHMTNEQYCTYCQAALINLINLCPYSNTPETNITVGGHMVPIINRMEQLSDNHPKNTLILLTYIRALVTTCCVAKALPTSDFIEKYNEDIPAILTERLKSKLSQSKHLFTQMDLAEIMREIALHELF
jgi:hypothetical protein